MRNVARWYWSKSLTLSKLVKGASICNVASKVVTPGVMPHQHGNRQPAFVSSNSNTIAWASSGGKVGRGVQVGGIGVDVLVAVMVADCDGVAVGSRTGGGNLPWVAVGGLLRGGRVWLAVGVDSTAPPQAE
jgi:hypothetical protein